MIAPLPPHTGPAGPPRLLPRVMVAAIAAMLGAQLFVLSLLVPNRSYGCDEIEHAQASWLVSVGWVPYADFFEHHTPAYHALAGLLLSTFDPAGSTDQALTALLVLRLVGAAGFLGTLFLTWQLTRRVTGRPAGQTTGGWEPLLAVLILCGTLFFVTVGFEIRPDQGAVLSLLGALILLGRILPEPPGRSRRTGFLCAGLLLGLAVLFTQKILLILPGVGAALLLRVLLAKGQRGARFGDAVLVGVGTALPVLATLAVFAAFGAGWAFIHDNFLLNAQWPYRVSPMRFVLLLTQENPELPLLAAIGALCRGFAWRRRGTWLDLLLGAVFLSWLAGLFILPVAQRQYFLLILPVGAIYAALGAAAAIEAVARRSVPLATAAGLILVAAIGGMALSQQYGQRVHDRAGQLTQIRYLLDQTPPGASVMNGWCSPLVFRPPAFKHGFLHREIQRVLTPEDYQAMVETIASDARAPLIVSYDKAIRDPFWGGRIPPELTAAIERHYTPTGFGDLWRRRD